MIEGTIEPISVEVQRGLLLDFSQQVAHLRCPQVMAVGHQDHGRVAMPIAAVLARAVDQALDLAVYAGHLTGCQGVLTSPSMAPYPSARLQLRRTPRIQNNSGLPQGLAGPFRCILSLR